MLPQHLAFAVNSGTRVQLGVTGSIAAYKALELLRDLQQLDLLVGVTVTEAAARFVTPLSFEALGAQPVYTSLWDGPESAFGHLEPSQEAACLVIAPATANTLARLAYGLADEILSAQALAFPGPVLVAPAMNPRLFAAAATQENLEILRRRGVTVIEPLSGRMACGETGQGRLAELPAIAAEVLRALAPKDLTGRKVLVTLGPTREYFDPARYWSNPSTGLMGACLAMSCWLRGAEVSVVHGPVDLWFPDSISSTSVTTAREMFEAATTLWPAHDVGIMTAAVSDFSPVPHGSQKFKKSSLSSNAFSLPFAANPDILRTLGDSKAPHQRLVGFCAETGNLAGYAAQKLQEKHCDLMVANSIASPGSGFASSTNAVVVTDALGRTETWPVLAKTEVAWRIVEWMTYLLG